jgi:prolyl-tRNA editing enzyme YbaK/EbsC (Cys-tRNA(Pro) deacylase)
MQLARPQQRGDRRDEATAAMRQQAIEKSNTICRPCAVRPCSGEDGANRRAASGWMEAMSLPLTLGPALASPHLLAPAVAEALRDWPDAGEVQVAEIDPALADTAAFCERYGVTLEESANCVVIAAKRGGETTYAACMVTATTRADVNGLVRRHLGARKASFGPVDVVVAATGMEYGGITPIGLPKDWPVLIDAAITTLPTVVIGSGIRDSKLWLPGRLLARLPGAEVLEDLGLA